jgi:hypothetical protein
MKDIPLLKKAIKETHGCESLHVESVPVKEVFEGQTAWEGTVEVFHLVGHPKAKRAYAWTYRDGTQNKTIAVLEIPPVDSPQSAVKVAIASKAKKKR